MDAPVELMLSIQFVGLWALGSFVVLVLLPALGSQLATYKHERWEIELIVVDVPHANLLVGS